MSKIIIRIISVLATLFLIAFIAFAIFAAIVDPNDYKNKIEAVGSEALGLPITIGNIELTSFPTLRITLQDTSIKNPTEFSGILFATEKITAGINLIPLLKGRLEIGNITIQDAQVDLATTQDGSSNWDSLVTGAKPSDSSNIAAPIALAISRITLDGATLRWQNLPNNEDWQATDLDLTIGSLIPGQKSDISLATKLRESRSGLNMDISGQLAILVNLNNKIVAINDLNTNIKIYNKTSKPQLSIALSGEAQIDLNSDTAKLQSLSISQGESLLQGNMIISKLSKNPAGQFDLTKGKLSLESLKLMSKDISFTIPNTINTINFSGKGSFDTKPEQIELEAIALTATDLSVRGKGSIKNFSSNPTIKFDIADSEFSLQQLDTMLDGDLKGLLPPTVNKIQFSGQGLLNTKLEQIRLNNIDLSGSGLSISGNAKINRYSGMPSIYAHGSIQTKMLDLNRYMATGDKPATTQSNKTASKEPVQDLQKATILPLYEDLDMDINVSISELKVSDLSLNKIQARILGKNKTMEVNLMPLTIFGGKFAGGFKANLKGDTLQWNTQGNANGLSIKQLLKLVEPDKEEILTGKLNLDYSLNGSGINGHQIRKSLSGDAEFSTRNTQLNDPELTNSIEEILAYFEKRKPKKDSDALTIDSLTGGITIAKGQATNRDLNVNMPRLHLRGNGRANLINNTLKYNLLVGSSKQKKGERIYIPIRISGEFDDLKYRIKFEDVAKESAKQAVKKAQKKFKKKIGDALNKVLKLPL